MKKYVSKEVDDKKTEIDYYMDQLKKELGTDFTPLLEKQFLKFVDKQEDLFGYTESFLLKQKKARKNRIKDVLEKHFEDRITAPESEFKKKGDKVGGFSTGYVAIKKKDPSGLPFMMKTDDEGDYFVNEFITAPLYKRTLYDRAPVIEGVTRDVGHEGLWFRSKFLHDFKTYGDFVGGTLGNIENPPKEIKNIKGVEKVFASMLAWGEEDMNAGNIGVMKVKDESGKDILVLAKIDHGWSATEFFTDPSIALEYFSGAYDFHMYQGRLDLNIDRFKMALDEITKISDEEIENLVKSRMYKLKEIGFDINRVSFRFWKDYRKGSKLGKKPPDHHESFANFDELEKHYIDRYKEQMSVMREVSKRLGIISKIDFSDDPKEQIKWQNSSWLQDIKGDDPILWAQKNNKTIEGLKPDEWVKQQTTEVKEEFKGKLSM